MALPDTERGGVDGYTKTSGVPHSVFNDRHGPSEGYMSAGF